MLSSFERCHSKENRDKTMKCTSCGSTAVNIDTCQSICEDCGCVQGTNYLIGQDNQQSLASTFARFEKEYKGQRYKLFRDIFYQSTLALSTPYKIIEEADILLPELWDNIKLKHRQSKQKMILALLFLLYRQNNIPMVAKKFQKKAHVWYPTFGTAIELIRKLFKLPDHHFLDLQGMITSEIHELVKFVFKNSNPTLERQAHLLAVRVANVIHNKEWENKNSKMYVSHIASVSTILAGRYVCSELTNRKTKRGNRASFRFDTLNIERICEHACVNKRMLQTLLKNIQGRLYELMSSLPWKVGNVTSHKDVPSVLKELLDHIELYTDTDLLPDDVYATCEVPSTLKAALMNAISKFLLNYPDHCMLFKDKWVATSEFKSLLVDELSTLANEMKSQSSVEVTEDGHVIMNGCRFMFGQVELLKDLLANGCSTDEILNDTSLSLVQKYLDNISTDDEELEEMSDNESSLYLKDLTVVSSKTRDDFE